MPSRAVECYRPRVTVNGSLGEQFTDTTAKSISGQPPTTPGGPVKNIATYTGTSGTITPRVYGITGQQTLFNGFQTANRTRAAEGQVSAAREGLRVLDQTVLLNAATVYMDVLRDTANLEVQRNNVRVLSARPHSPAGMMSSLAASSGGLAAASSAAPPTSNHTAGMKWVSVMPGIRSRTAPR